MLAPCQEPFKGQVSTRAAAGAVSAFSQKPPPPNPAQLCHGDPGDSFGTALGTGYCLASLYLQISKHFVNVKPRSLSREENSFCDCTDGETCPKMRAELGRQQGPELSQLSFPWAQSAATQIIPGRSCVDKHSSWEQHSFSRWESLAHWSTQKFIYNWCSKPQRLTHLSVFFFG